MSNPKVTNVDPDRPLSELLRLDRLAHLESPHLPRDPNCPHTIANVYCVYTSRGTVIVCRDCADVWFTKYDTAGALNG